MELDLINQELSYLALNINFRATILNSCILQNMVINSCSNLSYIEYETKEFIQIIMR